MGMLLLSLIKCMSNSFCINAFYRQTMRNDMDLPCCWLESTANIAQVRNDMLNDTKSSSCSACWKMESAGLPSKRTIDNKDFVALIGCSITQLQEQVTSPQHLAYQIKLSNHCNLACKTCHPQDSTGWYKEYNRWHQVKFYNTYRADSELFDNIDYGRARVIEFLGGEPLLHQDHVTVLKKLLEAGNNDCRLIYTTNGTCVPNDHEVETMKQFKNVWFNFSIDGVGPVFEYLRHPAQWNQVLGNIEHIKSLGFQVSCVHLLSNLNIYRLDEFMPWALKTFGVGRVSINFVRNYPSYFQPHVLPNSVKQQIQHKWATSKLWPLLKQYLSLLAPDANKFTIGRFVIQCMRQDLDRGQQIATVLPELVFFDNSRPLRKRVSKT
jgi:pyruvate-formate lyase-activating enzyme